MKNRFLAIFILGVFFFPGLAFAQTPTGTNALLDQCKCFCRSSAGAQSLDFMDRDTACNEACKAQGLKMLGCYKEDNLYPGMNKMCWTETECEAGDTTTWVTSDGETVSAPPEWGGQAAECLPNMGYCYPPQVPIKLGVPIQQFTETAGLGDYINIIYKFLIPALAMVAVVIIMIGGLQYILAHGESGAITKAKERITNAIIGLVLLLSAYAIANLIDPSLVNFRELRPPLIREVIFLDEGNSCDVLGGYGGNITQLDSSINCGDHGLINSLPAGITTTLEVGDECLFIKCPDDPMARCLQKPKEEGQEEEYLCTRCSAAGGGEIEASNSVCERLLHQATDQEINQDQHFYCEFDTYGGNECFEVVYPGNPLSDSLDCKKLREDAKAQGSESCRAYDLVSVRRSPFLYGSDNVVDSDSFYTTSSTNPLDSLVYPAVMKLCEDDPCHLAPAGNSCVLWWDTSAPAAELTLWTDCVDEKFLNQFEHTDATVVSMMLGWDVQDLTLGANQSAFRDMLDMPGFDNLAQITDVNGLPADFNPTW